MGTTQAGRDAVAPHKKNGSHARRRSAGCAFWVVLVGGSWVSPLTVMLPEGTEAIALFGGEEEAQMFCRFQDEEVWAISTIRRTTAGGVLSMLYCPWLAQHVVLDPLPGLLGERHSGQLALERERFARRFAGVEPGTVAG